MKRLTACWLRRSIATRLTAIVALLLFLANAAWFYFAWHRADVNTQNDASRRAFDSVSYIDIALPALGYDAAQLPQPGTEDYFLFRRDLAFNVRPGGPYILSYTNSSGAVTQVVSPLCLHRIDENQTVETVLIDISGFSENDIRALDEHMQTSSPFGPDGTLSLTVYGELYGGDYLLPGRIVSGVGQQVWHAKEPVPEQTSLQVYYQQLFYEGARERYFQAMHLMQTMTKRHTYEEGQALQSDNLAVADRMRGGTTICAAYTHDHSAAIWNEVETPLGIAMILSTLFLYLLYQTIRKMLLDPLEQTTEQACRVARLEFSRFAPDTNRGDEIGDLNRALANMANDLRARWDSERDLEERRQQFVAAASHDLKTPLALIGGYAEAIAQDISPEENARYLASIERETARMNELVREMLDYTKLDLTNELENRQTVDMTTLTQALLREYAPLLEHNRLTTDLRDGVRFRADETLLRRAIGCLLENAAKYTAPGGEIAVHLDHRHGALLFSVENECEPLPESEISRLFEMFYRGDKARGRSGHGLGLAIAQKIFSLHGLTCRAENTSHGVRFTIGPA